MYYVEPKRLETLGYLDARKVPGQTRARTVYTLTAKGHEALRAYARTPVRFEPLKSDLLQRLLVCDLVGEPITRASVSALREEIAALQAQVDELAHRAQELPHRRKYLLLAADFLRGHLELHLDLITQVEREFTADEHQPRPRA